jgi:uncharacterized protein YjiS (DUF1127 family)
MSVHTADSQFTFQLPSLSYIDAKWEEPNLRTPAATIPPVRKTGVTAWLTQRLEAIGTWRRERQAAAELALMSDYELMDIGLSRSDLSRVFDRASNQDLSQRGIHA